MKSKKTKLLEISIITILIIIIGITGYKFLGSGSKDIKSAKEFMEKIYSINAVNEDISLDNIKYEIVKKLNNQNELVHKTIITQYFGIDLDKNNNVIGFAQKDILRNINTKLTKEEAEVKAKEYLSCIYNEEVSLKQVISEENSEELPYYSFIFVKVKDGYQFYFDEIKVNINKVNGFLEGYSNNAMQKDYKSPEIKITKEQAEEVALETFNKYNKDGTLTLENDISLVFASNAIDKDASTDEELCYLIPVTGNDTADNKVEWKIFVNSKDKTVFNIIKQNEENRVTTNK